MGIEQTVTALHVVGDAIAEDTFTGDRIVTHMRDGGNTLLTVYRDGHVAEDVIYRRCDKVHRTFTYRPD